jgi:6-phospho-beta-glucosidase
MQYDQLSPFPESFLWGASTSAYQTEGGWDANGKGPSVIDARTDFPEGTSGFKDGVDHYNRFKEDVALFTELGLKAYRFSIAWSRVVPEGSGAVNPDGIRFYRELAEELQAHGITPIATLLHFDLPQALQARGGWSERATIDAFVDYARAVFEQLSDVIPYWLTINEQNMMIMLGEMLGSGTSGDPRSVWQQNHHMLVAQARVMALAHEIAPDVKIGPAPNIACIYPATPHPLDVIAAADFSAIRNWLYLDVAVKGVYNPTAWAFLGARGWRPEFAEGDAEALAAAAPDFIAFNYYTSHTVARPKGDGTDIRDNGDQHIVLGEEGVYRGADNNFLPRNEFKWEIDPIGFRMTFREIYDRYRLPLIVTENGLGAYDELTEDGRVHDQYRIDYLAEHIKQIQYAITDGVEVMGYCPWSAIDLVSTHQGIRKRYGFIFVDREEFNVKQFERYRKDSFFWYKRLIVENALPTGD